MYKGPKRYGLDFNGDGDVSFEESYLTYRIGEDIINSNNSSSYDDHSESSYGSSYGDSYNDFGGDDL